MSFGKNQHFTLLALDSRRASLTIGFGEPHRALGSRFALRWRVEGERQSTIDDRKAGRR